MAYNHQEIEKKWQNRWEQSGIFHAKDKSEKQKFYCLIEFPYPSGAGLHIGHPRSYTALDVVSRKRRHQGFNVLYPIGWDAFGLPTENYAIKTGRKPQDITRENTDTFRRQLKSLGLSFDWSREVNTTDPQYYKWTQWMFLEFFKAGLAYKTKQPINWCLSCKIGLANEEVVNGKCERCGGDTQKRDKEQWMIAITKYADRLLEDLDTVDYLEKIKTQQRNWIGKSEGAVISFAVASSQTALSSLRASAKQSLNEEIASVAGFPLREPEGSSEPRTARNDIEVFTTRPDTIFGATFLVVSPEVAQKWIDVGWDASESVREYVGASLKREEMERTAEGKEKTGVDTGVVAINPANGKVIPVWVADYVLGSYGTGAIMAVPAHDERDFEFAKKFGLKIVPVVLKEQDQSRSFVMGVDEQVLEKLGITIMEKTKSGFFKILIPFDRLEEYKELIHNSMQPGYWNEFSTSKGFYFIFKHKDGRLEEMGLNAQNNDLIDTYGMTFNDEEPKEKPENVYSWLAENEFYKEILIHSDLGVSINSDFLNGLSTDEANEKIIHWIEEKKVGRRMVKYKLRDWVFSRQRYWGEPIPLVWCDNCPFVIASEAKQSSNEKIASSPSAPRNDEGKKGTWVPVPVEQLPVVLPDVEKYEPTDTGESPLAAITDWVNTTCPTCGGPARRETDTMPNWAGSSWYFLAYAMHSELGVTPTNQLPASNVQLLKYWMPVDLYNGGMEHTTLHLLYSRFWNKFLFDRGHVPTSEPYARRHSHGLVLTQDGTKMSKSKGNVVNPDEIVRDYGADSLRMYILFMGPFEEPVPWSLNGLIGVRRFLDKFERYVRSWVLLDQYDLSLAGPVERALKKVSDDIESFKFNTAVSTFMSLFNEIADQVVTRQQLKKILVVLGPFAPHLANECWEMIGEKGLVEEQSWPEFDEKLLVQDEIEMGVQVNGKVRATIRLSPTADEATAKSMALADEKVKKHLEGKEVVKVVYVPGRILNIVSKQ